MNTSFPKNKIKVLLLEGVHSIAVERFKENEYAQVILHPKALPEEQLIKEIADAHIVGIRSKTKLTKEVLAHADKLMAIGCFCIGTNQVDLDAATEKGIAVFNSPYSNTRSVAELVIAECVMLLRGIPHRSHQAHEGIWLKDADKSYELRGKTLGIIGYGHIGSQVSVLAESMGMRVIYYDVVPKLPLGNAQSCKSLDGLLEKSDIVTLHVPADEGTYMMMNKDRIAQMKQDSYLINLSRGSVVEIDALKDALESNRLAGAAIDVFPEEPKSKNEKFKSSLQGLKNVILTPHIGGSTREAQVNIGQDAAQKLISYIETGSTVNSHTVPALNLSPQRETHRILHIHKNVPGVLSSINSLMSDLGVNILGQFLKTNEQIGYVVLDVEKRDSQSILEKVKSVEATIRARMLW
ncbi:UNVERIFIED_CONTAM: hypothetical protein GTU68_039138 [Idotea baltica]|nr:hypothetical protein [Idotea baltica]